MTEIEYIARLICARRTVDLVKIDSVAMAMRVAFGIANLTAIIPAVADAFYYAIGINYSIITPWVTAVPQLRFTDLGGGAGGNIDMGIGFLTASQGSNGAIVFAEAGLEFNSALWIVNGNTAGAAALYGTVFKITYA